METMRTVILLIKSIYIFPHVIAYMLFPARIRPDLQRWMEVIENPYKHQRFLAYCWFLLHLKEYRTLVYHRLGRLGTLLSVFVPPMPTCFLTGIMSKNIGAGLVIQHGHSMRLGAQSVGKNLQIWHNVTVAKDRPGGKRPVIGDNVKIFTGAVVLGGITIGDNVVVGACSVVLKSVPDNCVVVGNPARIVRRNGIRCDEAL